MSAEEEQREHVPHPTVPVNYRGQTVNVDEEIATLLKDLWALGFCTHESCQCGGGDQTYIYFTSREGAKDFFNLIYDIVLAFEVVGIDSDNPELRGATVSFPYSDLCIVTDRIAEVHRSRQSS